MTKKLENKKAFFSFHPSPALSYEFVSSCADNVFLQEEMDANHNSGEHTEWKQHGGNIDEPI